ncbi:MAG: hypothetical protein P9M15_01355 [Candidatus Electryoneaceae bacterium]|nr:hypothetical protein [Candidatus Electryoneaceae bacterium]
MTAEKKRWWCDDEGGIDFIQLVISLLIVSIACVGTLQALYYGHEELDRQVRYRKALSITRSYVEYWQGRVHTDTPRGRELVGNLNGNPVEVLLDQRKTGKDGKDINCFLRYALDQRTETQRGENLDYWVIQVLNTWEEPDGKQESISLVATMVPVSR